MLCIVQDTDIDYRNLLQDRKRLGQRSYTLAVTLLALLILVSQVAAIGVKRLSGADLKPDAFTDGAYSMVYYQNTAGEWGYFSGYIDTVSTKSVTLRQSQFHHQAFPLQQIRSALVGPTRKDVEAWAETWRRANLAERLDLPLDTEASRTYLPTVAAVLAAQREMQRQQLPLTLLADPDYIRGRYDGKQQISQAAGASFKLGVLGGAIGSLASALFMVDDILDGQSKSGWKMAGATTSGLVLPLVITAAIPSQPDDITPPTYPLGYRTAFNAQRGHLLKNAGGGWLLGTAAGLLASALYLNSAVIR